jgi:bidirectional [NiFe] hydrogenase diaphorase subunit
MSAAATATIRICTAAGCRSHGGEALRRHCGRAVAAAAMAEPVRVKAVGCLGPCSDGPLLAVDADAQSRLFGFATVVPPGAAGEGADDQAWQQAVATSLRQQLIGAGVEHAGAPLSGWSPPGGVLIPANDPFLVLQRRLVLERCGRIDPGELDDALAAGAYRQLQAVLEQDDPAAVIAAVQQSGLRGRGGAAYPTGLKWQAVAASPGPRRLVVCNGDEGDPGAFMDRTVLEGDPHGVLEGMAIAALAVGADHGFVYVRAEYPLAIMRMRRAIAQARRHCWLGTAIGGSRHGFDVEVRVGAGAYVCGEETALIHSIEGRRGTPRPRPPYPAERGVFNLPTLINNVETFANIPVLLRLGREGYGRGTKVCWKCRWAPVCARSSRPWAAAVPTAGRSRRCRPVAPPVAACRPVRWTCRSTTPACGPWAPCWAQAAWWCSTPPPTWWTWPPSSWPSAGRNRAASAFPAAAAPCSWSCCCASCWHGGARPPTWTNWSASAPW